MGTPALPLDLIEIEGIAHEAGPPLLIVECVAALEFRRTRNGDRSRPSRSTRPSRRSWIDRLRMLLIAIRVVRRGRGYRRGPLHLTLWWSHLGQGQSGGHEEILALQLLKWVLLMLLLIEHQLGEPLLTGAQGKALRGQRVGRLPQEAARQGATLAKIGRRGQGHAHPHPRIATHHRVAGVRVQGQVRVEPAQRLAQGVHAHGRSTRHHQLGVVCKKPYKI